MPMTMTIVRADRLRYSAKKTRAEISAKQGDDGHRYGETPIDDARDDERHERDPVDREASTFLTAFCALKVGRPENASTASIKIPMPAPKYPP